MGHRLSQISLKGTWGDASEHKVPPLRSLRFASVGMTGLGGLNLQGQNPHPNFAKSAKLEWGTLCFTLGAVILFAYEQNAYCTFTLPVRHVFNGSDFRVCKVRSTRLDQSVRGWIQQGRYEDGCGGLCG